MTPDTNPKLTALIAQVDALNAHVAAAQADDFEVGGHIYLKVSNGGQVIYERTHYFNPTPSNN